MADPALRLPALHPWNRGFAWTPARPPFRRVTREQAESWNERGFFLLEDAFDPATLAALVAELDPVEARVTELLRARPGPRLVPALHRRGTLRHWMTPEGWVCLEVPVLSGGRPVAAG